MDLTKEWGKANLKLDEPGEEYTRWVAEKDERIHAALPQAIKDDSLIARFGIDLYDLPEGGPEFREAFLRLVRTKEGRVGPEAPPGLYATKYRAMGSVDPRTRVRFNV